MIAWYTTNAVVLQATMTTLLLALSIQLPLRMGVFSFAGVGCFGIGGYTAAILYTKFDLDTWTAVALGTLLAGILCYLLGLIIHKLSGLYLGMATVAFTLIIAVVVTNGGSLTGGASGDLRRPRRHQQPARLAPAGTRHRRPGHLGIRAVRAQDRYRPGRPRTGFGPRHQRRPVPGSWSFWPAA